MKKHLSLIPDSYKTEVKTVKFFYLSQNITYIFALADINQLIHVEEGLMELMDLALQE